jgi:hypothetical protein
MPRLLKRALAVCSLCWPVAACAGSAAPATAPLPRLAESTPAPAPAATAVPPATPTADPAAPDPKVRLGPLTRDEVEQAYPDWVAAEVEAEVDPTAAAELTAVPAGAQVTVYFGTWCSDSRRELGRFWRALDEVGDTVPFVISYVGVDRKKAEPAALLAGLAVHHVPAFLVVRDGKEVGRVVEKSPHGIERDLADLLAGRVSGFLSATQRPDGSPPPPAASAGG